MTPPPLPVSDIFSNLNDQLATGAHLLGRSKHRQTIFEIVYKGKKQVKTIQEIANAAGISRTHVLKEGGKIAGLLLEKVKNGYKKKQELAVRYKTILALARNKKKLNSFPTKISPKISPGVTKINIQFPAQAKNAIFITIDDIDSFTKIRGQKQKLGKIDDLKEEKIKNGFQKIISEKGIFKDWGGERSDLYSTNIIFKGKRIASAIAFKGRSTNGKLVPAKMGKNGDQINRLFTEPAELFLVVYCGQIDSSIVSQMKASAISVAINASSKIYYGIVDGNDLGRLVSAYPKVFN